MPLYRVLSFPLRSGVVKKSRLLLVKVRFSWWHKFMNIDRMNIGRISIGLRPQIAWDRGREGIGLYFNQH